MTSRVRVLAAAGLVQASQVTTPHRALRTTEHWLYRITDQGKHLAASLEGERRRVLLAVHAAAAATPGLDGWAEEASVLAAAFPDTNNPYYGRSRLKAAVVAGLLERRRATAPGEVPMVALSAEGADRLAEAYRKRGRPTPAPTRAPRLDQAAHHLLVVTAALEILSAHHAAFVRLHGDDDLRARSRRGRTLVAGASDEVLPDGRLYLRQPDQPNVESIDIEILVSKYTDDTIVKKYAELPPTTRFYATTTRLQDRVHALVGRRPLLLS